MSKSTRTPDTVRALERLSVWRAVRKLLSIKTGGSTASAAVLRHNAYRPATPAQLAVKRARRAANKVARRQRRVNRLRAQR